MLIKNCLLRDKVGYWDILIEDGVIKEIGQDIKGKVDIDCKGLSLAIPPFIEPHIHLDTTLTAGEPRWNQSGTLFEGIECWSERKALLTKQDVKDRARKVLKWQIASGIQFVRTHVDVTDPELFALKALLELREEMKEYVELQIVAFPQEGIFSYPNGDKLLERALEMGADVIGAIPHFEFTREYGVKSIDYIFELAKKYDKLIDVHCDEIDDEQSRFIEVLATRAYENDMGHRVTASHTTAMHSYNDAYAYKLFRLLKMSKMNFIANPLVNIHLQGRFDTYPKRRGITRVKELNDAGINVCFGHDDIVDPWYPLGTGNMLQVCHMGLHVCQMMGYGQINNALDFITENSARALNIEKQYGLEVGKPGNLIILDARNGYESIRKQSKTLYSIRNGKVVAKTKPCITGIVMNGECELIDYKK